VILLDGDKLRDADGRAKVSTILSTFPKISPWPTSCRRDAILARTQKIDRIGRTRRVRHGKPRLTMPRTSAHPRHGSHHHALFRDKLGMRMRRSGSARCAYPILCPWFTMKTFAITWITCPVPGCLNRGKRRRPSASRKSTGGRIVADTRTTRRQAVFVLLEKFLPGDVYHVISVVSENEIVFANVSKYGKPPMNVARARESLRHLRCRAAARTTRRSGRLTVI